MSFIVFSTKKLSNCIINSIFFTDRLHFRKFISRRKVYRYTVFRVSTRGHWPYKHESSQKMVCSRFLVMKVLDIRCESHVFLTIKSRVAVGTGTIDPSFSMGPRVSDIDIYYRFNIIATACWHLYRENVLE